MLTCVLLPRGATGSVVRLFATSVPRWKVPTSGEGTATATAPFDADAWPDVKRRCEAQVAQLMAAPQSTHKATRVASKEKAVTRAATESVRAVARKEKEALQAIEKAKLKARKERIAANLVARKAKRVEMMKARRDRKEKIIANRKEKHAQLRTRAVTGKEQAATRAASESAEAKTAASLKKLSASLCEAALAKIQGLRMSAFVLFTREKYKKIADSMPGAPNLEGGMVGKNALALAQHLKVIRALVAEYKALSPEERDAYKVKAEGIRAKAVKNPSEMV